MSAPRKYDVLVDGKVVYTGLFRSADFVYSACSLTVKIVCESFQIESVPVVVLAVHM